MPEVIGERVPLARRVAICIFVATMGQLLLVSFAAGTPQFAGKGFGHGSLPTHR